MEAATPINWKPLNINKRKAELWGRGCQPGFLSHSLGGGPHFSYSWVPGIERAATMGGQDQNRTYRKNSTSQTARQGQCLLLVHFHIIQKSLLIQSHYRNWPQKWQAPTLAETGCFSDANVTLSFFILFLLMRGLLILQFSKIDLFFFQPLHSPLNTGFSKKMYSPQMHPQRWKN